MHDLQEIPLGCFQDEMIMVVHQDIGMNQDTKAIMVILHEAKELYPVLCIKKDFSPLIPTAGNMIQSSRIFNPNSSSHSLYISYPQRYVKFQGLTPSLLLLSSGGIDATTALAVAYEKSDRVIEAIVAYKRLGDDPLAFQRLHQLFVKLGDMEEAAPPWPSSARMPHMATMKI
jgi:hypothetical protein